MSELAKHLGKERSFVSHMLQLALLSPEIIHLAIIGALPEGIAVLVNGKEYFLRYTDFPWFEYCSALELRNMTADRWGVYWNALDIDLSIESLENLERFPEKISVDAWLRARNRRAAQTLGNIRSVRKAAASRHNGAKGGRPRKKKELALA